VNGPPPLLICLVDVNVLFALDLHVLPYVGGVAHDTRVPESMLLQEDSVANAVKVFDLLCVDAKKGQISDTYKK
jgi:hypothetical protein